VKGTTNGTISDVNGEFSIAAKSDDVLQISYIGFLTQEVRVGNQRALKVRLVEDSKALEEVVVIGYGTLEKKQVTNSITSIASRELPQGVGGATITNALKGKVSSLVIQETPSPNAATTLQLRGMASVNTSRAPLVVIDGMPGGDIRSVVQEDIQSIDILKDAAAGAIYGTRATGGVILITTKKAQEGKMKLGYTGEVIFKQNFGKPRMMTASEYLQYKAGVTNYGSEVDWWEEAINDNPTSHRHVLTLQGGSHDARIYSTVMYENNHGIQLGDDRVDMGGRINGAFKVIDGWLDINPHIDYRQAQRNLSVVGVGIGNNPTRSPYDPSLWETQNALDEINTVMNARGITNEGLDKWFRPDVELKLNILPVTGLSYNQTFGYEHRQYEAHKYESSSVAVTEGQNTSGKGTAELSFSKTELLNVDGYVSYTNTLGKHFVKADAGYSYFQQDGEGFSLKNLNFAVDGVKMWDIGSGLNLNNKDVTEDRNKASMSSSKAITQKLMAFFGRVNYSFMDKYLASATLRHEGSSKFAVNKRWGNFWQVSAAWRLSNEQFMNQIDWIDDLKIRAAYGVTGNEGFSAEYAATVYGAGGQEQLSDGTWALTYRPTKTINPDLGWEEKHEWNLGLDYELFNRRLFGKIDFYRRNVEGLIYEVKVPQPPNITDRMYQNIGTLENKGYEFEIGGEVYSNKDWNYTTKLNLSHNETKVGSMWGDATYYLGSYIGRAGNIHRIEENTQVGSFYLYKYAGLSEDGLFQAYDENGKIILPTEGEKLLKDKRYIGNYIPQVVAGWSHDIKYKNWSLGFTLTSWIDFDIYNEVQHTIGIVQGNAGNSNILLDAYTKNKDIKGIALECDYFLEDGTFLKIQNFTLGYQLDTKQWLKVLDSAKLYLTGNNLYTFTKYSGYNPEVDITGWEGGIEHTGIYPQTRTFALGVQLNF
jgi:TonB-linked SusC/RagA family outer membrane protein